jgi:acetolactate synthase small subunit
MPNITYTFKMEVRDAPGVLVRTSQVFARRSANISSVHVTHPADSPWADMIITVHNIDRVDRIALALKKLIDVNSVSVHKQVTSLVRSEDEIHVSGN